MRLNERTFLQVHVNEMIILGVKLLNMIRTGLMTCLQNMLQIMYCIDYDIVLAHGVPPPVNYRSKVWYSVCLNVYSFRIDQI